MEWFTDWWGSLDLFAQILYCIALPSTLILIVQTVLIIAGFGSGGPDVNLSDTSGFDMSGDIGGDMGGDFGGDAGGDISDGTSADMGAMQLFTFQGIITFLCVFSWSGIVAYLASGIVILSIIIGFVLGAGAMVGVAKIIQVSARLAQNGNIVAKNYLGETGTVYLPIPAKLKGHGKVNISLGERYVEFDAVTEGSDDLAYGVQIRVVDIQSGNTLVVEKA